MRAKWSKADRTRLEQRWSFTGIVSFLALKYKDTPMEAVEFITHSYRMASHVTHGDELGVNMIRERKSRSREERDAVHNAHFLRLLSDCFYYNILLGIYACKLLGQPPKTFLDLGNSLNDLQDLISVYHKMPFTFDS